MGVVLDETDKGIVNRTVDRVRETLDDNAFEAAWGQGQALDIEAALALEGNPRMLINGVSRTGRKGDASGP